MPVISTEKYYEKKNQGIEITENDSIVFYGAIANASDKSEDKYPDFFEKLYDFTTAVDRISNDSGKLEQGLEALEEFGEFFNKVEPGFKITNFRRIYDVLDAERRRKLLTVLEKINSVCETGLDMDAIKKSVENAPEAPRDEDDEPEDEVEEDEGLKFDPNPTTKFDPKQVVQEKGIQVDPNKVGITYEEYQDKKKADIALSDKEAERIGKFFDNIRGIFIREGVSYQYTKGFDKIVELGRAITVINELKDGDNEKDKAFEKINDAKNAFMAKYHAEMSHAEKLLEILNEDEKYQFIKDLRKINDVFNMGMKPFIDSLDKDYELEKDLLVEKGKVFEIQKFELTIGINFKKINVENAKDFIKSTIRPKLKADKKDDVLYRSWRAFEYGFGLFEEFGSGNPFDQQEAFEYIASLNEFLNRKEEGFDKTNFERTYEKLDKNEKEQFYIRIRDLKMVFCGNNLDVDNLFKTVQKAPEESIINNDIKIEEINDAPQNDIINTNIKNDSIIHEEPDDNEIDNNLKIDQTAKVKQVAGPMTAARYIEDIKAGLSERGELDAELGEKILKIMAARHIADSVRGYRDRLDNCTVTEEQINERVEELRGNRTIREFVQHITKFENRRKAFNAVDVRGRGHGGKLDDMLKDYAKKAEAGSLDNTEVMKRYMPTAKDRIEALQDKLSSPDMSMDGKRRVVLEIIRIRNISKAVRKEKSSLDKPIPATDPTIDDIMRTVVMNTGKESMETVITPEVIRLARNGHGGDMLDKIRENCKTQTHYGVQLEKLAFGNTIGTRMDKLKNKADRLRDDLQAKINAKEDTTEAINKCKKVIAEYLLLDGQTRGRNELESDPAKLMKDVPWDKVSTMKRKGPDNESQFKATFKGYTAKDYADVLGEMTEKSPAGFVISLSEKKAEVTAAREREKQAAKIKTNKKVGKPTSMAKK